LQGRGAASEDDPGERTFAETNFGFRVGVRYQQRTEKGGQVRIVPDEEEILAVRIVAEELLEVLDCCGGGERVGVKDLGFVPCLSADERGGLEAALQWAGDNQIELDVQCIQNIGELQAVFFSFFIKRALGVKDWIGSPHAGAGVSKDE